MVDLVADEEEGGVGVGGATEDRVILVFSAERDY